MANENVTEFAARAAVQLRDMEEQINFLMEDGDPEFSKNLDTLRFKVNSALKTVCVVQKKCDKVNGVEPQPEPEVWE